MTNEELKKKIMNVINATDISIELRRDDIVILADELIAAGLNFGTIVSHTAAFDLAQQEQINRLEREVAELKEKDINCVNSVDEMIKMCDGCGLHDCCGCEHSYSAVQGVKKLKHRAAAAEKALSNELVQKAIRVGVTDIRPWYNQALEEAEKELVEGQNEKNPKSN